MIKEDNKDQPPPALHSWSDMVFLTMATLAGPNGEKMWTSEVGSLKSVVMLDIKNAATKVRIQQALKKKGPPTYNPSNPPTYDFEAPHTFQWNSNGIDVECFNALLGTPLVSGVAWLLIQHKAQLGVKRISGITPFYAEFSLSRRGNGAIGYDGVARGKSRTLLLIISQTSTTLAVIIVRTP